MTEKDRNTDDAQTSDVSVRKLIDRNCDRFEQAWKNNENPDLLLALSEIDDSQRNDAAIELIGLDCYYRIKQNLPADLEYYQTKFPDLKNEVAAAFADRSDAGSTVADNDATIAPGQSSQSQSSHSESADSLVGTKIRYFGDYELLDEIARGGMGVVFRAKQISLNRIIALKMILAGQIAGEEQIRRFQIEAEAAANLDHPGIVPIYDIGDHDGQHYFSMKLIDGQTLGEISDELKSDHPRAIGLVAKVADAIHHAHQNAILHRDLKPGNVLIDSDDQPLVTDFGLARDTKRKDRQITQTGAVLGTPGFMAPEQAAGKNVTSAADIYSLGAILYQLLCGQAPHAGETVMDTLMSVIDGKPKNPRTLNADIHPDLELIVMKALSKEPADRYSSAAEFASDLRAHLDGEPLRVRAPSALEMGRIWLKNNYGNVVWVPIIAIVIGALTGFSLWIATVGQDMTQSLESVYPHFPVDEKPFLVQNWRPLGPWALVVFFLILTTTGWMTASLVKTKNKAADIGAGLSVGVIAGLIAFLAGLGAIMAQGVVFSNNEHKFFHDLAYVNDAELAAARTIEQYPTLKKIDQRTRINLIGGKREAELATTLLSFLATSSIVIVSMWGLVGLIQTWVAGPLVRNNSVSLAFIKYLCFALPLCGSLMILFTDVSMFMTTGCSGILSWTMPLLAIATGLLAMISVVRAWPILVQLSVAAACLTLVALVVNTIIFELPAPFIARSRAKIANNYALVEKNPDDENSVIELASSYRNFGKKLVDQTGDYNLSLPFYRDAMGAIHQFEERGNLVEGKLGGLSSDILYWGADAAVQMEDWEFAAEFMQEHTGRFLSSTYVHEVYSRSVLKTGKPVEQYLTIPSATDPQTWRCVAGQIRAIAMYKQSTLGEKIEDVDRWVDTIAEHVVNQVPDSHQSAQWNQRQNDLKRWLTSRQKWEIFGPTTLDEIKKFAVDDKQAAIDIAFHEELESDPNAELQADEVVSVLTGATVDLRKLFESTDKPVEYVGCYARTKFRIDKKQKIAFRFGSNDSIKAFIDGNELLRHQIARGVIEGHDVVLLNDPIEAGEHTIVFKVTSGTGGWGFVFDTGDENGWPLPAWEAD